MHSVVRLMELSHSPANFNPPLPGEFALSEVLVPQQQPARNRATLSRSVLLIAAASLFFSLWASFLGFHHSIFDFHGFRQSQTAISAEYMEHGGEFLRYQTPVLGSPGPFPSSFRSIKRLSR